MDVFVEQIVRRKKTNADVTKQSLILATTVILILICIFYSPLIIVYFNSIGFGAIGMLAFLGAIVGIGYGGFRLVISFDIEYEYIFTNGELDIDKVIAKRERKRLLTVEVKTIIDFGSVNQEVVDKNYDNRVHAYSDYTNNNTCYATFESATLGKTILIFNPNEKLYGRIKETLSPALKRKLEK